MHRSRLEIVAGIVQDCLVPRRKTQIMQRNNLSFSSTTSCLRLLMSSKLLLLENDRYRTTAKGLEFLSVCDQLERILQTADSSFGEPEVFSRSLILSRHLVSVGSMVLVK